MHSDPSKPQREKKKGFYRLPAVLEKIPVGKSTWWAGVKSGRYPAGVKISPRTTAWIQAEIDDLCERLKNGEGA
jgi:prophage regulatory protein